MNPAPVRHGERTAAIARLRRRAYAIVAALFLGTTIAFGESWLLEHSPTPGIECAFANSVAHVLEGDADLH
jgi:hypothetical protein